MSFLIVVAVIALVVIVLELMGFKIVPQSETMIVERLGKYSRTLKTGVNVIWPVLEKIKSIEGARGFSRQIDLRETVLEIAPQNVITKDNVGIEINAVLFFQISDPVKMAYEIANFHGAINKLTQTTLRNVIGELELDQTLSSRDTINTKLKKVLDEAADKWGIKVTRIELQDITPPEDIMKAMTQQMEAERNKRAQILQAEGLKQAQILAAEGSREAQIQQAEGEKQATILKADANASAILKVATAENEAIKLVMSSAGEKTVNYLVAMKYIDAIKEMVSGKDNKVVYVPYEATGVLGALGGIKELLGDTKKQ